jgi:hypothetical protein
MVSKTHNYRLKKCSKSLVISRRVRRHKESLKKIDNLIATHLTISRRVRRHERISQKIDNLTATHLTIK